MNKVWRLVAAVGAIAFVVSFFVPPKFHNAPVAQFKVISEMIAGDASVGQRLAFIAVAITLCFAYVSAGMSFVMLLVGKRADVIGRWLILAIHLVGGVAVVSLGITLIAIDDPWPAPGVRWYAAIAPWILVGGMALLTYVSKPENRWPVVLLVAFGLQLPLQLIMVSMVLKYHGTSWGYIVGAVGATLALVGAAIGLMNPTTNFNKPDLTGVGLPGSSSKN